ncbi:MAG TPA: argininosuccinate synthase [Chloroflexia bacterium]|nr:argininosuccinate synthase [Chloroflexia bacterium]
MDQPIAILAFSGGLDTSFCVPWLQEQGYAVVTVTVDTGGFSPADLTAIGARAAELGVRAHHTIDGRQALWDLLVSYIIRGNVLRGGVYPLAAGPERLVQAMETVAIAQQYGATAIAHGSTGAGNDQVRFDLAIRVLMPAATILAPIRTLGAQRAAEVAYLAERGIAVPAQTGRYSINKGLLGTTIGGGETLDAWEYPPDSAFVDSTAPADAPDEPALLTLSFADGLPIALDGQPLPPLELMAALAAIGNRHGVGRGIHLGNTILGLKGRIAFEAPAALIAITAHRELEKLVLTKQQAFWKDHLADVYGNLLHEGLYFDPVMRDIEALIRSSQGTVAGEVRVRLFKGHIAVEGCRSPYSLLNRKIGTYGETNRAWTGEEAAAFCKLYGLQSVLAYQQAPPAAAPPAAAPLPVSAGSGSIM